jgi:hypothetical protein
LVVCFAGALALLFCAWLIPIHLRAVDLAVVRLAGEKKGGAAAAQLNQGEPAAVVLVRRENRQRTLGELANSQVPAVRELLQCRSLTKTVLFPPSASAAGQAFDTSLAICGLLVQNGNTGQGLAANILDRATAANHTGDSRLIEEILMDEMSLGERLDWSHLAEFNKHIEDAGTLATLANAARNAGGRLPAVFSAVVLSQRPGDVAQYLTKFSETGLNDLATSERYGAGGVDELLNRNQRLYSSSMVQEISGRIPLSAYFRAVTDIALREPQFALGLKWFFFVAAGFLIGLGLQPAASVESRPAGGLLLRESLFACAVLFTALLLTEPFFDAASQPPEVPFRFHLPAIGNVIASQINPAKESFMNTPNMTASLLTLLLFFVLQALIYAACLSRLNETLRQNVTARFKLKLLENEEHLFDAGLYLGFVGTIICLILVSLGVLQFSLMAAYSSTSFGIIFVSMLKIFKVRPARRRLLLLAEEESTAAAPERTPLRTSAPTLVTAP